MEWKCTNRLLSNVFSSSNNNRIHTASLLQKQKRRYICDITFVRLILILENQKRWPYYDKYLYEEIGSELIFTIMYTHMGHKVQRYW